jgi:cardiolipin synthase
VSSEVTLRRGLTIPNAISVARIAAAPVFGWLWARGETAAVWVFLATVASDFLDGFLARVLDQRSRLGAILDPIADKLLNLVALVVGMWLGQVPVWWACVIFGREVVIGFGVFLGATRYRDRHGPASWQPSRLGKYAMLWQSVAVTLIVVGSTLAPAGIRGYVETAILMTALLTLISGAQYVIRASLAVWGRPREAKA